MVWRSCFQPCHLSHFLKTYSTMKSLVLTFQWRHQEAVISFAGFSRVNKTSSIGLSSQGKCSSLQLPQQLSTEHALAKNLSFLYWGPKLDALFQLWSHEYWVKDNNSFLWSHIPVNIVQNIAARAHCWLVLWLPSARTHRAFSAKLLATYHSYAILSSWVQHFTFVLVEFHKVPVGPFL